MICSSILDAVGNTPLIRLCFGRAMRFYRSTGS